MKRVAALQAFFDLFDADFNSLNLSNKIRSRIFFYKCRANKKLVEFCWGDTYASAKKNKLGINPPIRLSVSHI